MYICQSHINETGMKQVLFSLIVFHLFISNNTLRKKRYKSCHWGCTFSKSKLLSILGANMYILSANMYISGADMYSLICAF